MKTMASVKQLIKSFDDRLDVKSGVDVKSRDPLKNADFKADFLKKVRNAFEKKYKELNLNDSSKESMTTKFFFKALRF